MRKTKFLNQRYCIRQKNRYNVLMKHVISVKQKNLKTQEEHLLCDQLCDLEKTHTDFCFSYRELPPFGGSVEVKANKKGCTILRSCENNTKLHFQKEKKTKGIVESEYGRFDVDIYTHHYILKEEIMALEYDVMSGDDVIESYRLMVKIKKVV